MKAEELQIGDWVCYNKPNNWITKVESVNNPGQTFVSDVYSIKCYRQEEDPLYEKAHIDFFNVEILHPIPLTAEILEKNGFSLINNNETWRDIYLWRGNDNGEGFLCCWDSCEVSFYDDGGILVRTEARTHTRPYGINNVHHCDIRYVHQLQHALRLCGINKEIEL